jgi:guanylate kinase
MDARFLPVSAYTTRQARNEDRYRICISREKFDTIERTESLLAANEIHGHRYGTSKKLVLEVQEQGRVPILDCPIQKSGTLEREFPGHLFRVYIEPPSCEALWARLQDGRDLDGQRYRAACEELAAVKSGAFANQIDLRVVNREGMLRQIAESICREFWHPGHPDWPDPKKCKLKNDRYRNSRGGRAALLEILCGRCRQKVVLYQKDGTGQLYRLYVNRIFAPAGHLRKATA